MTRHIVHVFNMTRHIADVPLDIGVITPSGANRLWWEACRLGRALTPEESVTVLAGLRNDSDRRDNPLHAHAVERSIEKHRHLSRSPYTDTFSGAERLRIRHHAEQIHAENIRTQGSCHSCIEQAISQAKWLKQTQARSPSGLSGTRQIGSQTPQLACQEPKPNRLSRLVAWAFRLSCLSGIVLFASCANGITPKGELGNIGLGVLLTGLGLLALFVTLAGSD